jgi:predicted amidohydrolase YtcJ
MPADLAFVNGPVFTSNAARSFVRAVAVADGRITAVGAESEISEQIGPQTEVIDLAGRLLAPGFQDSHVHVWSSGLDLLRCSFAGCDDADDAIAYVAKYARANPEVEWIIGGGWHQTWFPRACPSKELLDAIVPDRPVFVYNADGHGAWANSKALELAGIDPSTPDPFDGRIERNSDGSPQGTLHDGAANLVEQVSPNDTLEDVLRGILAGQEYMLSMGITGWQDAHVDPLVHEAYRALAQRDQLRGTAVGALWWDRWRGLEQFEEMERMRGEGVGRYRPVAVKLMTDGVVETQTAAMLAPYLDETGAMTTNRGIDFIDPDVLKEIVVGLDERGFSCHFHAIGDGAVRNSLDAVEAARKANGWSSARHTICHVQIVHPDDLPRFSQLGVAVSAQALWAANGQDQLELTQPFLGAERTEWQYPFGSLLRAGATLAMGSDWAVSTANVLLQSDVAVNRLNWMEPDQPPLNRDERITLLDALAGFTSGSAWVNHREADSGSIALGMLADLVVLDRDPFQGGPIREARVAMTLVGGQVVYEED